VGGRGEREREILRNNYRERLAWWGPLVRNCATKNGRQIWFVKCQSYPLDGLTEYSRKYDLNLAGMQVALKEQVIVGFAGNEGMINVAR